MKLRTLLAPAAVIALAAMLLGPARTARAGFTTNGMGLNVYATHFRVFNNFTDPESNNNLSFDANVPGANGAALAIRKAALEWGSQSYGDGSGDPTQANLGDGGSNIDFWFGGLTNSIGGTSDAICSALSAGGGCTPGILAFSEIPGGVPIGFRMRFCDANAVFADGPGPIGIGEYDLQSVAAHEFGHLIGLGHTTANCGDAPTMSPTILASDVSNRSIEADDIAGVQTVHGVVSPAKPEITAVTIDANNNLIVDGTNLPFPQAFVRIPQRFPADPFFYGAFGSTQPGGTQVTIPLPPDAASGDIAVLRVDAALSPDDITAPFPFQLPAGRGAPLIYCTGRASSIGCLASITTTNELVQPVSGANNYSVIATDVHGFKPGILFFGINGPAAIFPWAGGYLCMTPPLGRGFIQISGGSGPNSCDGLFGQVINDGGAFNPVLDQGPGIATWFQFWYREPNNGAGMLGTALSNALEVVYAGP